MKKLFSFVMVAVLAFVLAGCEKYDDTELRNKVNGYEARIAALESLASYQTLLQKLQAGKTVTSYSKSDDIITLTFSDGSSVSFNQKGEPGTPGESIKGEDGKTPEVKIENDKWYVRYGEDGTWEEIGSAIDRSLIKDIKAEGNVLKITLADGNVISIPYGEKEGYTFTVGDGVRHYFSFWESKEAHRTGKITLPYTLTGDLKSIDDVTLVANVNVFSGEPIRDQEVVVFEPIDAKSGNVILKRVEETATYDWGQWWKDYSAADIDLMAIFPDGTTRVYKVHLIAQEILAEGSDGDSFATNDDTLEMEPIVISAGAGSFSFDVYNFIYGNNSDYYDGPELTPFNFKDILYCNSTSGFYANTTFTRYTVSAPQMTANRKEVKYTVTAYYQANTTGKERRCTVSLVRYMSDNSGTYLFSFPIVQPAL